MPQFSVWETETFFAPQDIIIVGSGFVGLWSALKLAKQFPPKKITILERGLIPTGASTRNAGFSCFGSPSELLADINKMGLDATLQLVAKRYRGLLQIQQHFSAQAIGYDAAGGYECFTANSPDWPQCHEQLYWLNEQLQPITGIANTFEIADEMRDQLGLHAFSHLVVNRLEGGLHSGMLLQALLKKVQAAGVQVLTGITVHKWEQQHKILHIHTREEIVFSAHQLLLCTNAFTPALLPAIDIVPCRGQVLLTAPIEGFKLKGTFHFDEGYYYFRNLGNRLLIGGARNAAFEEETTDAMQTTTLIEKKLTDFITNFILPGVAFTIAQKWSGIMAMGQEKLPIVKAVAPQVYCCVRMSGMGVALAPEVADEITALMSEEA
jgi:gamma-glutamylputrescine oxidase